jgi:hypothetical protein
MPQWKVLITKILGSGWSSSQGRMSGEALRFSFFSGDPGRRSVDMRGMGDERALCVRRARE